MKRSSAQSYENGTSSLIENDYNRLSSFSYEPSESAITFAGRQILPEITVDNNKLTIMQILHKILHKINKRLDTPTHIE